MSGHVKLQHAKAENTQTYILQYDRRLLSASNAVESYHGAIPVLLTSSNTMLWMRLQPWIDHLPHTIVPFQE